MPHWWGSWNGLGDGLEIAQPGDHGFSRQKREVDLVMGDTVSEVHENDAGHRNERV